MQKIIRIIDLSMPIEANMRLYPGMARPSLTRVKTHESHGLQSTIVEMSVHAGTHVDSFRHFISGAETIDGLPLETLIGEAVVFNLKARSRADTITSQDLEKHARQTRMHDIVILNTGCESNSDPDRYCTLGVSAAQWLVEHQIKCLGVDIPSVDPVPPNNVRAAKQTHPAHHILLSAGIPIVENLINLESLPDRRVMFFCLPLKIVNSEGAPARAVAIELE